MVRIVKFNKKAYIFMVFVLLVGAVFLSSCVQQDAVGRNLRGSAQALIDISGNGAPGDGLIISEERCRAIGGAVGTCSSGSLGNIRTYPCCRITIDGRGFTQPIN